MKEYVSQYIKRCIFFVPTNPIIENEVHTIPYMYPLNLGKNISMDFLGGLLATKKRHDYIFVVVYRFIKMCILMPCKKTIGGKEASNMFFE
jgi:hypothetical protein